jgi:hypothetical protein
MDFFQIACSDAVICNVFAAVTLISIKPPRGSRTGALAPAQRRSPRDPGFRLTHIKVTSGDRYE